jgi:hypothetical protein
MQKREDESGDGAEPTHPRVSLEKILGGMEFQSDTVSAYLNTVTGEVLLIDDESIHAADAGEEIDPMTGESLDLVRDAMKSEDYIPLPDRFEIDEFSMMERFAHTVPDDTASGTLLMLPGGAGSFSRFRKGLTQFDLLDEWHQSRNRAFEEKAVEWCENRGIQYER